MPDQLNVLLISPRFNGQSFWNFIAACELYGARFPAAPLGLITVAALLPSSWTCRLVNRNTETLTDDDLAWADLVMIGGMLPQRVDALAVIEIAQRAGKTVVVGGPDATSSPDAYAAADFRVLGEAEGVIDRFIEAYCDGARSGQFAAEKFTIDVTKTPIPRFDLLKRADYAYLGVQFSRGCPFTCEFCDIIELYGRVPRAKTTPQMLTELTELYDIGYRGHLDFVDDNFIGNKKALKLFLPHLIEWQKAHDYPFAFSTEASLNLADDDALLAMMREANFFTIFVGIESSDAETLVATQKKQNTRRDIPACIEKIYAAGMFVNAGFIVGFDSERGSIAEAMIDCIERASIPVCMVGPLFALPGTQLTRRLDREGRLFPLSYVEAMAGVGDQCTAGLNFATARERRDILDDYRHVLKRIHDPAAYFARVERTGMLLSRIDRSVFPGSREPGAKSLFGVPLADIRMLASLFTRLAKVSPRGCARFLSAFVRCALKNPGALEQLGVMAALYLHLGPFSRFVIAEIDQQIDAIDKGLWTSPLPPRPLDATQAVVAQASAA